MTMARRNLLQRFVVWLAGVAVVDVGKAADGLTRLDSSGAELDKPWQELYQEFTDALTAWRKNPLARRIIGLITAYVVGDGLVLDSDYAPLKRFLAEFQGHEQNRLLFRQPVLCDELSRAGELFLTLHMNMADGMSYLRPVSASLIDRIEWRPGDYETELRFHETVGFDDPDYAAGGRWWMGSAAEDLLSEEQPPPLMLHYSVNRPVGCLRGESDLAPILPWLKRYSRWLEDRVRLNAAVRAYLWIVGVPGNQVGLKGEQYRRPPEAGSVMVVDRDNETWSAVAPNLRAMDVSADGRAIRWMIAAGGPGIGLMDLGEAEEANLATARAMGEQRLRFMAQRQAYFGYILAHVALVAYNRAVRVGKVRGREQLLSAVLVGMPDISAADNADLAGAAASIAQALTVVQGAGLAGSAFRQLVLRLVLKFAGESLAVDEQDRILQESESRGDRAD